MGKSPLYLADFLKWRDEFREVDTAIMVTRNNLKSAWAREHIPLFAPHLKVAIWTDAGRWEGPDDVDMFVINFEALVATGGKSVEQILQDNRCAYYIDECHRIMDPNSSWSKRAIELRRYARITRGGTGTPTNGNVMCFYPQLKFAKASELEGWNHVAFRKRYALLGGFKGKQVIGYNEEHKPELDALLDRYSFRALKTEYTDLPPKLPPVTLRVSLPKDLEAQYHSMYEDFIIFLDEADPDDVVTANMIITQMLKLQQISSGFVLDERRTPRILTDLRKLPKFREVVDLIESIGDSKLIIFTFYRFTAEYLMTHLTPIIGQTPAILVGGMKADDFDKQKDKFNSDSGPKVLIAQQDAGGVGHTLLGGANVPCHTVLFYENKGGLIDRQQAEDRPHRHGQTHAVSYFDIASSPIEEKYIVALQTRREIARMLVDARRVGDI